MTTPRQLADRVTAIAGSVDLSGFAPFFSPLTFFLNENLWMTITLIVSLVATLLITFAMVGWRRGCDQPGGK
jgi:hypothetical protein